MWMLLVEMVAAYENRINGSKFLCADPRFWLSPPLPYLKKYNYSSPGDSSHRPPLLAKRITDVPQPEDQPNHSQINIFALDISVFLVVSTTTNKSLNESDHALALGRQSPSSHLEGW